MSGLQSPFESEENNGLRPPAFLGRPPKRPTIADFSGVTNEFVLKQNQHNIQRQSQEVHDYARNVDQYNREVSAYNEATQRSQVAAQQAAEKERLNQINAEREAKFRADGRPFYTDRATGELRPEQSDDVWSKQLAKKHEEEAEVARRKKVESEISELDARSKIESLSRPQLNSQEREAKNKELKEIAKQAISSHLIPKFSSKAKEKDTGSAWNPFDSKPTEEATKASEKLKSLETRLFSGSVDLDDDELAELENDAPETANRIRETRNLLKADEENQNWIRQTQRQKAELQLKLANPQAWVELQRKKLDSASDPDQIKDLAAKSVGDFKQKAEAFSQEVKEHENQAKAFTEQEEAIIAENDDLIKSGISASDLVSVGGKSWHREALAKFNQLQQNRSEWLEASRDQRLNLAAKAKDLEFDQQAAQAASEKAEAVQKEELTKAREPLRKDPILAPLADKLDAIDEDLKNQVVQAREKYKEGTPEFQAAVDAIQKQAEERYYDVHDEIATAEKTKVATYDEIRKGVPSLDLHAYATGKLTGTHKSMVDAQIDKVANEKGIDANSIRETIKQTAVYDWSGANEAETSRIDSKGELLLNPNLAFNSKAYKAAVAASNASPEAKQRALEKERDFNLKAADLAYPYLASDPDFDSWKQDQIARNPAFARINDSEKALAFLEQEGTFSKFWRDIKTKYASGGGALKQSFYGLRGLLGDRSAEKGMSEVTDGMEYIGSLDELTGMSRRAPGLRLPFLGKITAGDFVNTVVGSSPAIVAGLAGGGLAGAALIGGLQSSGSTYADAYDAYRKQGMGAEEARAAATFPAIASGIIEAAVTAAFGKTGVEAILKKEGAKALIVKNTKQRLASAFSRVATSFGKEGVSEMPEEFIIQALDSVVQRMTYKPELTFSDALKDSLHSAVMGFALGGTMGATHSALDARRSIAVEGTDAAEKIREMQRQEQAVKIEAAKSSIDNFQPKDIDASQVEGAKTRAKAVLEIAQGNLNYLTVEQLASVGYLRQNGDIVPDPNYNGPAVLDFQNGDTQRPIIRDSYLQEISKRIPAVAEAVAMSESDMRKYYANQEASASLAADRSKAAPTRQEGQTPKQRAHPERASSAQEAAGSALSEPSKSEGAVSASLVDTAPATPPPPSNSNINRALTEKENEQKRLISQWLQERQVSPEHAEVFADYSVRTKGTDEDYAVQAAELSKELQQFGGGINARSVNNHRAVVAVNDWLNSSTPKANQTSVPTSVNPAEADQASKSVSQPGEIVSTNSLTQKPEWQEAKKSVLSSIEQEIRSSGTASDPIGLGEAIRSTTKMVNDAITTLEKQADFYAPVIPGGVKLSTEYSSDSDVRSVASYGGGLAYDPSAQAIVVDLKRFVDQFASGRETQSDAIEAVVTEEFIHRVTLSAIDAKEKVEFFDGLMANTTGREILNTSWKAYYAANQDIADKGVPDNLTEAHKSVVIDELLRQLIQDKRFRGKVTEAMDLDPDLGQVILDFLKKFVRKIRKLISDLPTDLRAQSNQMEREAISVINGLIKQAQEVQRKRTESTSEDRSIDLNSSSSNASILSGAPQGEITEFHPGLLIGKAGRAYADNNESIDYRWAAVDISDLVISNLDDGQVNPEYPQVLQPRDRNTSGSEAQVQDIAKNSNFDRLSVTKLVSDGAPVVGNDAVVESGNGRMMGLRRAYEREFDSIPTYKARLIEESRKFGLDPSEVSKLQRPVLVRVRTTPLTPEARVKFVERANVSNLAPMREVETARKDARNIPVELFSLYDAEAEDALYAASNMDFIRAFVREVIPSTEQGGVVDSHGVLSQAGLRRIRNALFVSAYGDNQTAMDHLARLTESLDENNKNMLAVLTALAPKTAWLKANMQQGRLYDDLDISSDIIQAVSRWTGLRQQGQSVADYVAQGQLAGIGEEIPATQRAILGFFERNIRSVKKIKAAFHRYHDAVETIGDPRQGNLFGETKHDKAALFSLAVKRSESAIAAAPRTLTPNGLRAAYLAFTRLFKRKVENPETPLTPSQENVLERAEAAIAAELFDASPKNLPQVHVDFLADNDNFSNDPEQVWQSIESHLASEYDGSGARSMGSSSQGSSQNESRLSALQGQLWNWANSVGRQINAEAFAQKIAGNELARGEEHLVYLDPESGRVIKITVANSFGSRGIEQWIKNIQRSNKLFGDDIQLVGAIQAEPNVVQLVVSQPFHRGTHPTQGEIDKALEAKGYFRVGEQTYFNTSNEEAISDAKPANFIKLDNARVVPIDVHFLEPNDRLSEIYSNIVSSRLVGAAKRVHAPQYKQETALKVYRKLMDLKNQAQKLTIAQEQALREAEKTLGQKFFDFDVPTIENHEVIDQPAYIQPLLFAPNRKKASNDYYIGSLFDETQDVATLGTETQPGLFNAMLSQGQSSLSQMDFGASNESPSQESASNNSGQDFGLLTQPTQLPSSSQETAKPKLQTSKTETKEKSGSRIIQDFGEKIGGARKDLYHRAIDSLSYEEANDAGLTLSKHFPDLDYESMLKGGADINALAAYKALRDTIPTKPKRWNRLRGWAVDFRHSREKALKYLKGEPVEFNEQLASDIKLRNKIELYQAVGFPLFTVMDGYNVEISSGYTQFGENKLQPKDRVIYPTIKGRTVWGNYIINPTPEQILGMRLMIKELVQKEWDARKVASKKPIKFEVFSDRLTGDFFIGKKGMGVVRIKTGFKSSREAFDYIKEHQADLEQTWAGLKAEPITRRAANIPREGVARREGDVTPEMYQNAFGFRGVQFGNWVEGDRRQADLNESFDALMDLAEVLRIPPKALSLNGALGIAFGARGTSNAKAHYEPDYNVINITKKSGPGSLAHEWFHALDSYMGRIGSGGEASTPHKGFASDYPAKFSHLREQVKEAFVNLRSELLNSSFYKRSAEYDKTRSKPYYSTAIELAARGFESYVLDRLENSNILNDYLVNIDKEGSPVYPTKEEMDQVIRPAYDRLVNTLDTKPTDAGYMIFSPARYVPEVASMPDKPKAFVKALFQGASLTEASEYANVSESATKGIGIMLVKMAEQNGASVEELQSDFMDALDASRSLFRRRNPGKYLSGIDVEQGLLFDELPGDEVRPHDSDKLIRMIPGIELLPSKPRNLFAGLLSGKDLHTASIDAGYSESADLDQVAKSIGKVIASEAQREGVSPQQLRDRINALVEAPIEFDGSTMARYLEGLNAPKDLVQTHAEGLANTLNRIQENFSLEYTQGSLFASESQAQLNLTSSHPESQREPRKAIKAKQSEPNLQKLADAFSGDWRAMNEILETQGRASSILHDLVDYTIPSWNVDGSRIKTPADVAALMMPIRSPYFETLKVMVLDDGGKIVSSQIVHVGSLNQAIADSRSIFAVLANVRRKSGKDYRRIVLAHNHPSGLANPSTADDSATENVRKLAELSGFEVVDHVITNGHTFYSYASSKWFKDEKRYRVLGNDGKLNHKATWEVIERHKLPYAGNANDASQIAAHIRTGNPDAAHIVYLDTRLKVTAIERVSAKDLKDINKTTQLILEGSAREGAYAVCLEVPYDAKSNEFGKVIQTARMAGSSLPASIIDVFGSDSGRNSVYSAKSYGWLEQPTPYEAAEVTSPLSAPERKPTEINKGTPEKLSILQHAPRDQDGRLLAPNGQPSNLSEDQYVEVRTQAYKQEYGDWEELAKGNALRGQPVAEVKSGDIQARNGERPTEAAYRWLAENPQDHLERAGLGKIVMDRGTVETSLAHKFGHKKLNALPAVPEVIRHGVMLDSSMDKGDRPLRYWTLAAPVEFNGERHVMFVRLRQNVQAHENRPYPRFHVHEIALESDIQGKKIEAASFKTGGIPIEGAGHTGESSFYWNLYRKAVDVNPQDIKVPLDVNGEPVTQGQPLFSPARKSNAPLWSNNEIDKAFTNLVGKAIQAVRSTDPVEAAGDFISNTYRNSVPGKLAQQVVKFLKKQLVPNALIPREARALMTEMQLKQVMGKEAAMDLHRSLGKKAKFSDIGYPPGFADNPMAKKQLYMAMAGEIEMSKLPKALQDLAQRLRDLLVKTGKEAVRAGRMSSDTLTALMDTYMPHYFEDPESQTVGGIYRKFKLGMQDINAQRTTAWHLVDHESKDPKTGLPRLIEWSDNGKSKWRFKSAQHRDAYYDEFIKEQVYEVIKRRQIAVKNGFTRSDLDRVEKLDPELRGRIKEITSQMKLRYGKEKPLTIDEREQAGLIMDPVYAVSRYVAQMTFDNATAEFFQKVASNKDWVSDVASPGFTAIPDNRKFGALAGKYLEENIAEQVLEMVEMPNAAVQLYDTILSWWKAGKTVFNPGSHVRNVIGNLVFAQLSGSSLWNPSNLEHYRDAIKTLREGGSTYQELYEHGVIGGDFANAELRSALKSILPDPKTVNLSEPSWIIGIGKSAARAANSLGSKVMQVYTLEDEVYKVAAYLKAKASGLTPNEAASHVRKWFPYYDDIGNSPTLRAARRTLMPFLSFYRESIRIFGHAVAERPIALTSGLALPTLISVISASLLGLDDDDLNEIQKDMRGKGKFFLQDTPLFSILLPIKDGNGNYQMYDLSNTIPFADHLGRRLEDNSPSPSWQYLAKAMMTGGPIGSILYGMATGKESFGDRNIWEADMTPREKATNAADYVWSTLAPPVAPGGTSWKIIGSSFQRSTNKTLEKRSPGQALARTAGIDVRNANPNLYRIAEDWRKANGLPADPEFHGGTTEVQRLRARLFAELAQDGSIEEKAGDVAPILRALKERGQELDTPQAINRLLFYRNPLMIIKGKENQQRFLSSLKGLQRDQMNKALQEFERIKSEAPAVIARSLAHR